MCNASCVNYGKKYLTTEIINGKRIIEVGSKIVGGISLREDAVAKKPKEYIGCDIVKGKNVDIICSIEEIINQFGEESFDVVINTEMLEHVENWKLAINNLKLILRPKGYLLLTTRSKGFKKHNFPHDFWRFEIGDFKNIFDDLNIINIDTDKIAPGVFIFAQKPKDFNLKDLSEIIVYKID